MKKITIILSVVLFLLLLSLAAYYFLIQGNNTNEMGESRGFRSFFPFGGNDPAQNENRENTPEQTETANNQNFTKKLRRLSSEQVSGAGLLDIKAGTLVRYIEKATGHIFEVELFSPRQVRISNTTMPLVYDAVWGNKNTSLITRYLKDDDQTIETYSISLKNISTSTENTVSGTIIPGKITEVSALGDLVFTLENKDSSSAGYVSAFDGSKKKQIWVSEITELLSQFVNSKTVALTTKPLENVSGFLYFVDTTSGQVRKIIGDIKGLSTLIDNAGEQIIYLEQDDNAKMFLNNTKTKSTIQITPVTFPEKCVWSKKNVSIVYCAVPKDYISNNTLTSWYKGFLSFSDDIWKYDLKNNSSQIIENLNQDAGEQIDVIKPMLSDNEQYLVFINKKNNTLWSLDLLQ